MKILFYQLLNFYMVIMFWNCCKIRLTSCHEDLNFIIEGPGLNPLNIVMPARYFYIYIDNKHNGNFSYSYDMKQKVDVKISGKTITNRECRTWVNILDRNDGSFIVRYKLFESCFNFIINVLYNKKHIAQSPYKIEEMIQTDDCDCPNYDFHKWFNNYGCKDTYFQINSDLNRFPTVDYNKLQIFTSQKFNNSSSMSVCNYVIYKNEIFRKCYGQHVGFKMFMDAILLSLTRKVRLPDLEMYVNLGDWPLVKLNDKIQLPMFSWCGSTETSDIVLPTYDITESSLECMGRVSLDMLSVQGNIKLPWNKRTPKAFWRGRDSNRYRLNLVDIAKKNPDLFNVSLTNFFFFRDEEHKYGPKEKHVSFFDFFEISIPFGRRIISF
uniref:Glycosyl transferase CAP10 domain-containing protein n=1 Tax=Clastoptera arizonana TaxID=38151 RepID=A0A1B6CVL0_9HEMI